MQDYKMTYCWHTLTKEPKEKEHLILNIGTEDAESYYYQSGYFEKGKWYRCNNNGCELIPENEYVAGWCYVED